MIKVRVISAYIVVRAHSDQKESACTVNMRAHGDLSRTWSHAVVDLIIRPKIGHGGYFRGLFKVLSRVSSVLAI